MKFEEGIQLGAGFVVGAGLVWLGIALILALLGVVLGNKNTSEGSNG